MTRHLLLFWLVTGPLSAQTDIVIRNANVIPMTTDTVLPAHALHIQRGRIMFVAPNEAVATPANALVIDAAGAHVIPGLADMHIHLVRDPDELPLYVAAGVTTVRELSGEPLYHQWRSEIASGQRVGPNLVVGGPMVDRALGRRPIAYHTVVLLVLLVTAWWVLGFVASLTRTPRVVLAVATTPLLAWGWVTFVPIPPFAVAPANLARVRSISATQTAADVRRVGLNYDAIKLYEYLTPSQFRAATRAGSETGVRTVGHVPDGMRFQDVIGSGLDEIAHLYFFAEAMPDEDLDELITGLADAGMSVVTTMTPLFEQFENATDPIAFAEHGFLAERTPMARASIRFMAEAGLTPVDSTWLTRQNTIALEATRRLVLAGVPVLMGTDNQPRMYAAGRSAHRELELMVRAGLTPYQALVAATVGPGAAMSTEDDPWGTLAEGQRADLVMLAGNPLDNIEAIRTTVGVMVRGRWFDRDAIDAERRAVIARRSDQNPE